MSPTLRAAALLLGVILASASSVSFADLKADVISQERFLVQSADAGRKLVQDDTPRKCVWDTACKLNPDFVTTLSGVPSTESQKLVARAAGLKQKCESYESETACVANAGEYCAYSILTGCVLTNGYLKPEWGTNRVSCAGSLADQSGTCARLTSSSTCTANTNCVWEPGFGTSAILTAFTSAISGFSAGTTTLDTQCYPKWTTNTNTVNGLIDKISNAIVNTPNADASTYVTAVFKDVAGNCRGVNALRSLVVTCTNQTTRTTCENVPGCSWGGALGCDAAENALYDLLLDSNDSWVTALRNAKRDCLPLDQTACEGSAAITINTTRYAEFRSASPTFPIGDATPDGAAGMTSPGAGIMLLSLLLCALMALLTKSS